uniref:DUF1359 domain-containing protein n=1 Tax=Strongyloides stercoralis TaxID=6248 RepID=A0A0K0EIY3_STRER
MASSKVYKTSPDFVKKIKELILLEKERQTLINELDIYLIGLRDSMRHIVELEAEKMGVCWPSSLEERGYRDISITFVLSGLTKCEELINRIKKNYNMSKKLEELLKKC